MVATSIQVLAFAKHGTSATTDCIMVSSQGVLMLFSSVMLTMPNGRWCLPRIRYTRDPSQVRDDVSDEGRI